jgi:uncharacterized protein
MAMSWDSKSGRSMRMLSFLCACIVAAGAMAADVASTERSRAEEALRLRGVQVNVERLIQYAGQGDWATVEQLLVAGVVVTAADGDRHVTALHNAAAQGHARIVRELIARGADVNARDWMGATPLVNAAYFGRTQVIDILLSSGAQLEKIPSGSTSPLLAAVQGGALDSVVQLLKAGADPDQKNADGISARALAVSLERDDLLRAIDGSQEGATPK